MGIEAYKGLIDTAANTGAQIYTAKANGQKIDAQQMANVASNMLTQIFGLIGQNEKAANDGSNKADDIKNSSQTTKEKTDKVVAENNAKIEKLKAEIEENLKLAEEKNEERERIEQSLQCEVQTIEEAQKILNDPEKSHEERMQAIETLMVSKEVIDGLKQASDALAKQVTEATNKIEGYQTEVTNISEESETAVTEGQAQIQANQAAATQQAAQEAKITQAGTKEIAEGEAKVAAGTAASVVGGASKIQQGTQMIAEGTYTVGTSARTIGKITKTSGEIHTDLASMKLDEISIGDAKSQLITITDQIHSYWGVLGVWADSYNKTLTDESTTFAKAVDAAEEKVNNEPVVDESNTETNKEQNSTDGQENNTKIFEYDTSLLKSLKG